MIISCDFDSCLVLQNKYEVVANYKLIEILRRYHAAGYEIHITTFRDPSHENASWVEEWMPWRILINDFIQEHSLPIKQINFTKHEPKGSFLQKIGAHLHFDDFEEAVQEINALGIRCIWVKDGELPDEFLAEMAFLPS